VDFNGFGSRIRSLLKGIEIEWKDVI